ncbi:MAG TPA: hypothetical protein VMJ52_07860 [Xanthobacteraceae bacterium]|nr:hypothetical protein [Xanthobacteraceae bacterium]
MLRMTDCLVVSAILAATAAYADEIRRTAFAPALLGTWAPGGQTCDAKSNNNIVIAETSFNDNAGSCKVDWIVETAAAAGTNYSVHAACTDQQNKTSATNRIIRLDSNGRVSVGASFDDLKPYQRCPAK